MPSASQQLTRPLEGVLNNPLPVGLADMRKSDRHLRVISTLLDAKGPASALEVGNHYPRKVESQLDQREHRRSVRAGEPYPRPTDVYEPALATFPALPRGGHKLEHEIELHKDLLANALKALGLPHRRLRLGGGPIVERGGLLQHGTYP